MANRYFKQFVLTQDNREIMLAGSIALTSGAAVSSNTFNSLVASVTKTATGEYTITLADKYVKCKSVQVQYQGTGDVVMRVKSVDVASAKTIVVETWDLSSAAVADVGVASVIYVNVVLNDSSI